MRAARGSASVGGAVFGVSTAFPIVASIWPADAMPTWVGILDGVVAFAAVGLAIGAVTLAEKQVGDRAIRLSYRIYRGFSRVPLGLLVLFFVVGDRINWNRTEMAPPSAMTGGLGGSGLLGEPEAARLATRLRPYGADLVCGP